jgi:hypothetical protein
MGIFISDYSTSFVDLQSLDLRTSADCSANGSRSFGERQAIGCRTTNDCSANVKRLFGERQQISHHAAAD